MLYSLNNGNIPQLPRLEGLELHETTDILLLSVMARQSPDEVRRRLANDNKAFVAFYNGEPAAFGWMAMGKARIGELNHEFVLPLNHRYLWNFRTLDGFRGLGIYPRLLQYIVVNELPGTECFWILHAPENDSSASGIVKAGFIFVGNVSLADTEAVVNACGSLHHLAEAVGFRPSYTEAATCWLCSIPFLYAKNSRCCCEMKNKKCNGSKFSDAEIISNFN